MVIYCLSMLAGAYSLELFRQLPPAAVLFSLILVAVVAAAASRLRIPALFLLGFAVMGMATVAALQDRLSPALQGSHVIFSGRVLEFAKIEADSMRLVIAPLDRPDLPARIRLTWLRAQVVPRIGEVWRLQVRLRRPRGYANPGGFDYALWLFRQRIGATGYVVAERHNYRVHGAAETVVDRLRRDVVQRIEALIPADDAAAVLLAIAVGARHKITREQWDLYAATGTSHLMAISGLHIGLAAGCAYFLCWLVLAVFIRRRNIRDIAIVTAIVAAGAYATMSGFAVPARRALLMAIVAGAWLLLRRKLEPGQLLATTCITIFLSDPLAILAPGFKLSFAAVAVLFAVAKHYVAIPGTDAAHPIGRVLLHARSLAAMQMALLAGLFPLTVLLFGRFTVVAPLVNILVLPVFNFVTVPLSLVGMLLDGPLQPLGDQLLELAYHSTRLVLRIVTIFGEPDFVSYRTALLGSVAIVLLPILFSVAPPGWPGRRLAFIAILAVLNRRPASLPPDCLDFHALDVGQGLAIVVQTRSHALLFDTGPSFQNGGDTAQLVVLPFLRKIGIDRLDAMIVSHADLDHAGGVRSIINNIEVASLRVGEIVPAAGISQTQCVAGDRWSWDGISFKILHPRKDAPWTGNNSSCVLQIDVGEQILLFPGDIEGPVEKLLAYQSAFSRSHVVFVPHHGSRTSSSTALVSATRPNLAIVSAGFGNRWDFPREEVVSRWEVAGAQVLNTASSGALSQRVCRDGSGGAVREQRQEAAKYWHDTLPGSNS